MFMLNFVTRFVDCVSPLKTTYTYSSSTSGYNSSKSLDIDTRTLHKYAPWKESDE